MDPNKIGSIIILTVTVTLLTLAVIYFASKAVKSAYGLLKNITGTGQHLLKELSHIRCLLQGIQGELAYMRSMTQGGISQAEPQPQPPIGRAGTMPGRPQFPSPVWDHYPTAEPAKPDDTDTEVLEQTEQELIEAQNMETLRERGIEPDEDDPRLAVVEEA